MTRRCAALLWSMLVGACQSPDSPSGPRPDPGASVARLVAEGDGYHAIGDDVHAADCWQRAEVIDRALAARLGVTARLTALAARSGVSPRPPNFDGGTVQSVFESP